MKLPKKIITTGVVFFLCLLFFSFLGIPTAKAEWVPDLEVTAVGKSAERARQLLFWFFNRPSLDNSPAILAIWAVTRNIALALFVVIVVLLGFQLIMAKQKTRFEAMLPKLAGLMVFTVFSYVLVLGLVQIGDVVMKFFIKSVAGQDLFNITFAGGNVEDNYKNFVGYLENSAGNLESIKTSLFLIKTTTFTYNVIFTVLVVRKIVLWFLLIVSPLLPLLFVFPLIKNVGWIWVGVFFQWLFYGPLFSVFLASLVKIWSIGIPFGFDFVRAKSGEIVYPTAINILYGGPKQALLPNNSANYVDTYAEYIIGLIMLWVVLFLPWLLLRIFRDYCCEALKSVEAATMNLYGRMGGAPSPSLPSLFKSVTSQLPLRKSADVGSFQSNIVSKMKTEEILNSVGLQVSRLSDISRLEMNSKSREESSQKLEYLQKPSKVTDTVLRQRYSVSSQELYSRAVKGDQIAERTLSVNPGVSAVSMVRMMQTVRPVTTQADKKGKVFSAVGTSVVSRTISVDDYEETKKLWLNQYREGEIPVSGEVKNREEWLQSEVAKISDTVELLSAKDETKRQAGLERVSGILPFLLLGGFTEEQTLVYLKAKMEAAKQTQIEIEQKKTKGKELLEQEGDEMVKVERQKKEQEKTNVLEESLGLEPEQKNEK